MNTKCSHVSHVYVTYERYRCLPMSHSSWHKTVKKKHNYYKLRFTPFAKENDRRQHKIYSPKSEQIIVKSVDYISNCNSSGNRSHLELSMESLSIQEFKSDAFWTYLSICMYTNTSKSFSKNIPYKCSHLWSMVPATRRIVATSVNIPRKLQVSKNLQHILRIYQMQYSTLLSDLQNYSDEGWFT